MKKLALALIVFAATSVLISNCNKNTPIIIVEKNGSNIKERKLNKGIWQKYLADEFVSNPVSAERKYSGRLVRVYGRIASIDKELFSNKPVITFGSALDFESVKCNLNKYDKFINKIRVKDEIIVLGEPSAEILGMGAVLKKCRIIGII